MKLMKIIFSIAITMAITIALTMSSISEAEEKPPIKHFDDLKIPENEPAPPLKRGSRFLAETTKPRNPDAADHCHKDYEVCRAYYGKNTTCCSNKCINLSTDNKNCGACKKKCKFTETCCRGKCVNLNFDKRHCGYCNHRCKAGEYCLYGMCDYA